MRVECPKCDGRGEIQGRCYETGGYGSGFIVQASDRCEFCGGSGSLKVDGCGKCGFSRRRLVGWDDEDRPLCTDCAQSHDQTFIEAAEKRRIADAR